MFPLSELSELEIDTFEKKIYIDFLKDNFDYTGTERGHCLL